jgi:uncharacterized protein YoxC
LGSFQPEGLHFLDCLQSFRAVFNVISTAAVTSKASSLKPGIFGFVGVFTAAGVMEWNNLVTGNTLGIGTIIGAVVGIIVWLLKDNRKQAVDVNKQFLDHMQQALEKEQAIHATYAESINKMAAAIEANTATLTPLIGSVKEMSESMKQMSESVKRMVEDHHRDIENLVADWRKANRSGSIDERI